MLGQAFRQQGVIKNGVSLSTTTVFSPYYDTLYNYIRYIYWIFENGLIWSVYNN